MKPIARSSSTPSHYHAVRFYDSDRSLARIVADFLAEGVRTGNPGIVVATPIQRAGIIRELMSGSLDVVELERSRELLFLDARETLATFMRDGKPDPNRFRDRMCEVLQTVCRGRADCTVRIFGQMVDVLWQERETDAAIRLEILWNHLARTKAFSLLCGYSMGHFYKDAHVDDVCRQHSHVLGADGQATAVA